MVMMGTVRVALTVYGKRAMSCGTIWIVVLAEVGGIVKPLSVATVQPAAAAVSASSPPPLTVSDAVPHL